MADLLADPLIQRPQADFGEEQACHRGKATMDVYTYANREKKPGP